MSSNFLIGVDGGGTRTRAVLCDPDGQILGRGDSGSSNLYGVGIGEAAAAILDAVREAVGSRANALAGCGLGLAGAHSPVEVSRLREILEPVLRPLLGANPLVIEEDAVAAWAGAFGGEPGIICIAGTGANAFGIGPGGRRGRADGLGPLLGDRGSGIRIGEAALRAACAAQDGVGPKTNLLNAILSHFGITSVEELVGVVYAPDFARSAIAGLVPTVADCAVTDHVARGILMAAGRDLAASVTAVVAQLGPWQGIPVAPIGGVLENLSLVRQSFASALRNVHEDAIAVRPARFEPVVGAAFLPILETL